MGKMRNIITELNNKPLIVECNYTDKSIEVICFLGDEQLSVEFIERYEPYLYFNALKTEMDHLINVAIAKGVQYYCSKEKL